MSALHVGPLLLRQHLQSAAAQPGGVECGVVPGKLRPRHGQPHERHGGLAEQPRPPQHLKTNLTTTPCLRSHHSAPCEVSGS